MMLEAFSSQITFQRLYFFSSSGASSFRDFTT